MLSRVRWTRRGSGAVRAAKVRGSREGAGGSARCPVGASRWGRRCGGRGARSRRAGSRVAGRSRGPGALGRSRRKGSIVDILVTIATRTEVRILSAHHGPVRFGEDAGNVFELGRRRPRAATERFPWEDPFARKDPIPRRVPPGRGVPGRRGRSPLGARPKRSVRRRTVVTAEHSSPAPRNDQGARGIFWERGPGGGSSAPPGEPPRDPRPRAGELALRTPSASSSGPGPRRSVPPAR